MLLNHNGRFNPKGSFREYFVIGTEPISGGAWKTWRVPKTASMVMLIAVGSAGGGGAGFAAASGTEKCGGGGGGSGAMASLVIPAFMLPRVLYFQVPVGGVGGSAAVGANGGITYICDGPGQVINGTGFGNVILTSGVSVAQGGGVGTTSAGGAAGSQGGAALSTSDCPYLGKGSFTSIGGQPGVGGGTNGVAGTSVTWGTSFGVWYCGGAGGGGCSTTTAAAGGGITIGNGATLPALSGGAATGANGVPGTTIWVPLQSTGGSGGGAGLAVVGGAGGNGGLCSGGGGGGGGTTGGIGGNGGPGLVYVCWW